MSINAHTFLSQVKSYDTDFLAGAVETLYQFSHIDREDYDLWMKEVKELETQKTAQLLKGLAA